MARALEPLAGHLVAQQSAIGLVGAALHAASNLPLSTAYSVCVVAGRAAGLDDSSRDAPLIYLTLGYGTFGHGTFGAFEAIGAGLELIPSMPLVSILVGMQVINAILLLSLFFLMSGIAQNRDLMCACAVGKVTGSADWIVIALVAVSIATLAVLSFA